MVAVSALLKNQLLADADLCVKCGLCLPHCPTYGLSQHEGDSPRGRIALLQGLAGGRLALTEKTEAHLDGCLSCRACESVCPAHVPYGRLLDRGRALMAQQRPARTRAARVIGAFFVRPLLRSPLFVLLWLYQHSGAQHLLRRCHLLGRGALARLESLLPRVYWPRRLQGAPSNGPSVSLFTGCTGEALDRPALEAARDLLQKFGYSVNVPPAQVCCGALHQHAGLTATAQKLAAGNCDAFNDTAPVLGIASGCTAQLRDYEGSDFSSRVDDVLGFLDRRGDLQRATFKPLPATVALHLPCTLRNVVKAVPALRAALARIPELTVVDLDPSHRCCGAAGSHFITHAADADALLAPKLSAAQKMKPDFVLSANIGCSMHLAGGLRRADLTVPVLHPVQLLARQFSSALPAAGK